MKDKDDKLEIEVNFRELCRDASDKQLRDMKYMIDWEIERRKKMPQ